MRTLFFWAIVSVCIAQAPPPPGGGGGCWIHNEDGPVFWADILTHPKVQAKRLS